MLLLLPALLSLACEPDPPPAREEQPDTTCSGSDELCHRRLSEVTFPATHNSMSSEEAEWWFPNQGGAVPTQLEDGVRGLNLDIHYWVPGEE